MTLGQMLHTFFTDGKVYAASIAIALRLVLGVLAAWKVGTFRLSYLADFMRGDVLFKLLPYFIVYAGAIVAGGASILIPGLDLGDIAMGLYAVMMASWVGSIAASLEMLRSAPQAPQSLKLALTGKE